MATDKQRLEALEQYVFAWAHNTGMYAVSVTLWSLWIPIECVSFGACVVLVVYSILDYRTYLKAKT